MALGEGDKVEMLVKTLRRFVDGVDNDGESGDLSGLHVGAMKRVDEKKFAEPLASMGTVDGQTAEERRRDVWIGWKFPGDLGGQIREANGKRGQRVVAENGFGRRGGDGDKGRGDKPPRVLGGYLFEIAVKRFVAAGKSDPVVFFGERLDKP